MQLKPILSLKNCPAISKIVYCLLYISIIIRGKIGKSEYSELYSESDRVHN